MKTQVQWNLDLMKCQGTGEICPAFPDLTSFCYKHLYTELLSKFRAVQSFGTRNTRTGQQNYLKLVYCTHRFSPHWSVSPSSLAIFWSHADIYLLYRGIFYTCFLDCVRYNEDFVKSRFIILRFCSKHFIVILDEENRSLY